jgi:Ca2+-binding RTX toxin-like protein
MAVVTGTAGDDVLYGGKSADTLYGLEGNDVLRSQDGSDLLVGAEGNDTLISGSGNDTQLGGIGDDYLFGQMGNDVLDGGDGTDVAVYSFYALAAQGVVVNLTTGIAAGWQGNDILLGIENVQGTSGGDDSLTGSAVRNLLWGDDGNDTLSGLAGNDYLDGGAGNDFIDGGEGDDFMPGGDGIDVLSYAQAGGSVKVDLAYRYTTGAAGADQFVSIENVIGSAYADFLIGDSGNNELWAGAGNDTLFGGDADDVLDGEDGIDAAKYRMSRSDCTWDMSGAATVVNGGPEGVDTLLNIERLQFQDLNVALDLDGNAGIVAKILGAVFGPSSIHIKHAVGIGLSLLDTGTTYEQLMQFALDANLGSGATNGQVVDLLLVNLTGIAPSQATHDHFVALLNNQEYTQTGLAMLAAETGLNQANIGLAGLIVSGLEYL